MGQRAQRAEGQSQHHKDKSEGHARRGPGLLAAPARLCSGKDQPLHGVQRKDTPKLSDVHFLNVKDQGSQEDKDIPKPVFKPR